jgi:hypothetical protein
MIIGKFRASRGWRYRGSGGETAASVTYKDPYKHKTDKNEGFFLATRVVGNMKFPTTRVEK